MGRKLGIVSILATALALVPAAVAGATELTIEKSDAADPVQLGEAVGYTIVVENTTAGIASDVKIVDDPPDGMELIGEPPTDCIFVFGVVECERGEVGFGGSFEVEFGVMATEPGTFLNEATVETSDSQNTANDTATETTTVLGPQHELTVVKDGSGSGTVSSPLGIDCGSDCSETFDEGSSVTLTATPDPGSVLTGWGGDCAGATGDTCDLTMSAEKTARATFGPAPPPPPAGPPTPPPPDAELTAPSTASFREMFFLNASKTTGATELAFDLNEDHIYDFIVPPSAPYVGVRTSVPGNFNITLAAIGINGLTSFATVPVNVTSTGRTGGSRLPGVAIAGSTPAFVTELARSQTCEPRAHVYFYAAEASGCLTRIARLSDIPEAERDVAAEYQSTNFLTYEAAQICPFDSGQCEQRRAEMALTPFYARSTIHVNGMTITPRGGASVVVFPAIGRIVSSNATLNFEGGDLSIPVQSGPLNLDVRGSSSSLTAGRQEVPLFSFNAREGIPGIGGFPFDGEIKLSFAKENGRRFSDLSVSLALPEGFSSAVGGSPTGKVTLEADNDNGLILSKLLLEVKEALLGGVRLSNLSFTYLHHGEPAFSCSRKWWKATAEIFLVPASGAQGAGLKMAPEPPRNGVAFCAGGFHSAGAELQFGVPIPPPMIFPGVFLDTISFSMQLKDPTVLEGTAGVTAGKIVKATGALMSVFATPSHPYVVNPGDGAGTLRLLAGRRLTSASFAIGGSVGMKLPAEYVLAFGNGYMIYQYPDYISAGGELRVQTLAFTVKGGGGAEISATTGRFNANAHGKVCIIGGFEIEGVPTCIGGLAWVSTVGAVACFELPDDVFEPGIGYHWGDKLPEIYLGLAGDGCKPSRYWERNVKAARAAAARYAGISALKQPFATGSAAPLAFEVRKGEKTKNVRLPGSGGAPAVTVRAPNGETLSTVPNLARKGKRLRVLAAEEYDTTWIGVDDARPGTYTITPQPGSAPIAKISETRPRDDRLKASVSGKGGELTLSYDVGNSPGQVVTFFERGKATWRQLGSAKRGKGRIRFKPAVGPAGKRQIVAMVEVDGIPGAPQTVARFKAPSSAAGRVKGVQVTRRGKALRVFWQGARNAVAYTVLVDRRDGVQKSVRVKAKRHSLRIKGIPATQGGIVKVAALGPLGDWGKPGAARFKALRKAPSRLLPFSQLGEGIESPTSKSLAGGR